MRRGLYWLLVHFDLVVDFVAVAVLLFLTSWLDGPPVLVLAAFALGGFSTAFRLHWRTAARAEK